MLCGSTGVQMPLTNWRGILVGSTVSFFGLGVVGRRSTSMSPFRLNVVPAGAAQVVSEGGNQARLYASSYHIPVTAGVPPLKIPAVDGMESEGLVLLALLKFIPRAASCAIAEVGLFFTHKAKSSECIPSIESTRTWRALSSPCPVPSSARRLGTTATGTASSVATTILLVLFIGFL